jgi:hypothetical protein
MPGRYVISKRSDGWVIAVDGEMLLICERKKAAIRAVREAMRNAALDAASGQDCGASSPTETPEDDAPLAIAS